MYFHQTAKPSWVLVSSPASAFSFTALWRFLSPVLRNNYCYCFSSGFSHSLLRSMSSSYTATFFSHYYLLLVHISSLLCTPPTYYYVLMYMLLMYINVLKSAVFLKFTPKYTLVCFPSVFNKNCFSKPKIMISWSKITAFASCFCIDKADHSFTFLS